MTGTRAPHPTDTRHAMGLALVLCGTTLFSSKSIIIQWLYGLGVSVDQLILLRMLFSFPFYVVMGSIAHRQLSKSGKTMPTAMNYLRMMFAGFICYHLASYLDMWALQSITAGLERIILFSYPLMIAVYQHTQGHMLKKKQWGCITLAYAGVILFYYEDQRQMAYDLLPGVIAVAIAAVFTAYYSIASQRYSREFSSDLFTAVAMGVTALSISCHILVTPSSQSWVFDKSIFIGIFMIAIGCTVLASWCFNRGIAESGAVYGSVFGMLGPILTVTLSAFFLDTTVNATHVTAIILVVIGVIGTTVPHSRLNVFNLFAQYAHRKKIE